MKFKRNCTEKREKCIKETRIVWDKAELIAGILTLGALRVAWAQYGLLSPGFLACCLGFTLVSGPVVFLEDFVMRAPRKVVQRIPSYNAEIEETQRSVISAIADLLFPEHFQAQGTILLGVVELVLMIAAILIIPWDLSALFLAVLAIDIVVLPFLIRYAFYMCRDYRRATKREAQ